jgi:hypothetical protein
VLGMLLLLGFLALRLLASAVVSLLYLMLAPAAVLAPALGDGGRTVFRKWATQLLAAVVSKLLFSFLLGAILAVLGILENLEALGWWTQWLLMSAFWWSAFIHRHRALQVAAGATGRAHVQERRTILRRASEAFETPRRVAGGVRAVRRRRDEHRAARAMLSEHRRNSIAGAPGVRQAAGASVRQVHDAADGPRGFGAGEQARRTLLADYGDARAHVDSQPALEQRLSVLDAQLARLREQHASAVSAADGRRATTLAHRATRVQAEAEHERAQLAAAQGTVAGQRRARGREVVFSAKQIQDREQFLEAQAALDPGLRRRGEQAAQRRNYRALAGLAGYAPREYEGLSASDKRTARLEIDRELGLRTASGSGGWAARSAGAGGKAETPADSRGGARSQGTPAHARRGDIGTEPIPRQAADHRHEPSVGSESSVMADVREVAARRKRQLGRGRP